FQHALERREIVGFARRLVPADAVDARETHGDAGFVPRRVLQSFESNFEHQPKILAGAHGAHRTEALDRVVAHESIEFAQLLVGEAEVRLAHRRQRARAVLVLSPDTEGVIGIEARALAVAALRVHEYGVDQMWIAFPFEP